MSEYKQNEHTCDSELIYGNDCPYIEIQWQIGQIFVSNTVLKLIGNPDTIRFQWSASKCSLIIEPTDIDDANGISVSEWSDDESNDLFIDSPALVEKIWQLSKWDKSWHYCIVAKYNAASNVAIFDMKDAVATENSIDDEIDDEEE